MSQLVTGITLQLKSNEPGYRAVAKRVGKRMTNHQLV
jgi:hypothetical protein